jgi:hypothetical protein
MSIIIPDTESADAEIWITTIDNPFHENETGHLLTVIPFCKGGWKDSKEFRGDVLSAADALAGVYQHYPETISIEVKFKENYINY